MPKLTLARFLPFLEFISVEFVLEVVIGSVEEVCDFFFPGASNTISKRKMASTASWLHKMQLMAADKQPNAGAVDA